MFAEFKNVMGLRRLRLRRMKFVREQFLLGRGPEHQAVSPVPEPTDNTYYGSCHLAAGRGQSRWQR